MNCGGYYVTARPSHKRMYKTTYEILWHTHAGDMVGWSPDDAHVSSVWEAFVNYRTVKCVYRLDQTVVGVVPINKRI
jgi:hypothetical protein